MNTPPDTLPPVPAGYVYLGRGGYFTVHGSTFEGLAVTELGTVWRPDLRYFGISGSVHYCAPEGSEIVKLNQPQPPADPKQHIIWCPQRGEPTKLQPSLESAETEAKRLAAKHPGMEFHVCEVVASYVGEVTVKKV